MRGLTTKEVENAKPRAVEWELLDPEFHGYCFRIRKSDRKMHYYKFRWAGKPDKVLLGEFPGLSGSRTGASWPWKRPC